jgi:integrase
MPRQNTKLDYLKLHHRTYYFRFRIPKDVRHAFYGKHEVLRSLQTDDLRVANIRKQRFIDFCKSTVKAVRSNTPDALIETAQYWLKERSLVLGHPDVEAVLEEESLDQAIGLLVPGGWNAILKAAGANPDLENVLDSLPQAAKLREFIDIAAGKNLPYLVLFEKWVDSNLDIEKKTRDMAAAEVKRFAEDHPHLDQITKAVVAKWLEERRKQGLKPATLTRSLVHLRNYWKYLQRNGVASEDANPFNGHSVRTSSKANAANKVKPWSPEQILELAKVAKASGDDPLHALILIAAYSGMRIEEICSMLVDDIKNGEFSVVDAKTSAGIRLIPVHSHIQGLIDHLIQHSKDAYLISGLSRDKYGNRSVQIGKRFGRLKTRLGFKGRQLVFHSFRHSFATALLQADVRQVTVDLLMGHQSGRLSVDRYSEGISREQRLDAIERIRYFHNPL